MRYFWIFLLICGVCFVCSAETINEKYSYKAFPYHNVSFKDIDPKEFNDSVIVGSCFFQEWVEGDAEVVKDIFPEIKGVTFDKCNIDNIYIDETKNTALPTCTHKIIKVQNDLRDWILDNDLKPIKVCGEELWIEQGYSVDPKDIPIEKLNSMEEIKKVQ